MLLLEDATAPSCCFVEWRGATKNEGLLRCWLTVAALGCVTKPSQLNTAITAKSRATDVFFFMVMMVGEDDRGEGTFDW